MEEKVKKRNIFKIYLSENKVLLSGIAFILFILCFMGLSYIIGDSQLSKEEVLNTEVSTVGIVLKGIGVIVKKLVDLILPLLAAFVVIVGILIVLKDFYNKQKAIYRYAHFSFSPDGLRQMLAENKFAANINEYLEYINKQLIYGKGMYKNRSIQLRPIDVLNILKSAKEVFGENEVIVSHGCYKRVNSQQEPMITEKVYNGHACLEKIITARCRADFYRVPDDSIAYLRLLGNNNAVAIEIFSGEIKIIDHILEV